MPAGGLEGLPPSFPPPPPPFAGRWGGGEGPLLVWWAFCLPGPSPSTQVDGELSAVLTGVGPAEPAREPQVCSEMTMQHLRPGDVDGDAHLSREALALSGDGHGPWVLRGDKGQFPWK